MVEFFIAVRHILERKFQSIFSILGVAIAVTVFIVSLTVSNGLEKNMITSLLTLSPHIQIKSTKGSFFNNYGDVIEKTKGIKDVKAVIPQINSQSIIKFDNFAKGVLAKGMEAENVKNDLKLRIVKGNNNISELNSILIGEGLSKEMNLKVGDELSLVSAENKELILTVRGIFKTGFLDYDSNLVIIPLKTMQILGEQGEVATEIGIITGTPQKIEEVEAKVYEKLQKSGKFSAEIASPDQKDASGEMLLNLAIAANDAAAIPPDHPRTDGEPLVLPSPAVNLRVKTVPYGQCPALHGHAPGPHD